MLKFFENDPVFKKSVKLRPVEEISNIQIFRPLAHIILLKIKDKNISPELIVIIHTFMVILSSILIYYKNSLFLGLLATLFLQLKTILDNLDGQLARYKNKTTNLGRYLDTLMDYLGNFTIFIALGLKYNQLTFSLVSFFIFTFVLSYDFNIEKIYKGKNCKEKFPHKSTFENYNNLEYNNLEYNNLEYNNLEIILEKIYNFLLGYQDKLIIIIENKIYNFLLEFRYSKKFSQNAADQFENLFWKKEYLNITVNMGLSTQLLILGILIIFNLEFYFLYLPFVCLTIIMFLFIFRIVAFIKHRFKEDKL
ncbi:MAG: CDP-alcohol phosphatidyltransferase family protein [bacterium]